MIYVLPGMGADRRMFPGPWQRLPEAVYLDWNGMRREETLTAVARRIVDETRIPDSVTLVGCSLGGMVAGEIAKIRRVKRLFLVGSARSPREVSRIFRMVHPLARIVPMRAALRTCGLLPGEVFAMLRDADPDFMRHMCRAMFRWEGLPEGLTDVRRIHGRRDLIIPAPRDGALLLDGGHLIAMTHAEECVRWIEAAVRSQTMLA